MAAAPHALGHGIDLGIGCSYTVLCRPGAVLPAKLYCWLLKRLRAKTAPLQLQVVLNLSPTSYIWPAMLSHLACGAPCKSGHLAIKTNTTPPLSNF